MLSNSPHTLVILAAGASSRMRQSLERSGSGVAFSSKALLPLGEEGRPALDFLLHNAIKAGIQRILMVVPENSEAFRDYFEKKNFEGISLDYALQNIPAGRSKPFGTADALLQCMQQYPELKENSFLVCNGDNFYSVEAFTDLITCKPANALIGYNREGLDFSMERIAAFALLEFDGENRLISIIEKPTSKDLSRYHKVNRDLLVSMNLWKFQGASIYPYLLNCPVNTIRDEKELPTAVLNMIHARKAKVHVIPRKEHVPDLTSAEDIEKVASYFNKGKS